MATEESLSTKKIPAFVYFGPFPFSSQNNPLPLDPFENKFELSGPPLQKHDPLHYFKSLVRKIPNVEKVLFSYQAIPAGKDIVHFYTIVNTDNKDLRKQIYAGEMELMQKFPKHSYNFDFHLVARRGKPLEEILKTPGCAVLFDKSTP